MNLNFTLKLNHMIKKSIISCTMLGVVALALASSGGGMKKSAKIASDFVPVKAPSGFTLKAGPQFTGSKAFSQTRGNFVMYNTISTYQKGNTIYILPYKYKMTRPGFKSNLNLVDLKFKLGNK